MIPFQPGLRARISRAFLVCLFGLGVMAGLGFVSTGVTQAQTGLIMVQQNQAQVRYREGVEFKVAATINGSQITQAQLKVKYGKKGREETYPATFAGGTASYMVQDEAQSLATGMPLTYSWILSGGNVQLQTNPQTVVYEDTRHTWFQREGPQVTVRWYNGDDNYGNLMYQLAADTLGTYKRRFNMDPQDQIYITIYGSSASYHSTFPDVPEWSGGFSRYGGVEIVAIAPQDHNSSIFIGEGIPHELSHAALYQFLHGPAPRWLDEGFAVYNQNIISIKEYDQMLQQAYRTDSLIPLSSLDNRWPSDETAARLAYAEGRSIVTFLINSYGNEVWTNILDQLRRQDIDGAFNEVFGVNLAQMEDLWKSKVLGGVQVALPTARKTGPVPSQPTAQDFATKTAANQIQTPVNNPAQADSGLFWLMLGIALVAVLAMVILSAIVIRNRRREAALYRFRAWSEETRVFAKTTPGFSQTPLPPAPLPVARAESANRPYNSNYQPGVPPPISPAYNPVYQGYTYRPTNPPGMRPEGKMGTSEPNPVPASGSDPFDFISARFEPKAPGVKTYKAGSVLDHDPYGLNFGAAETDSKEKTP
jgi:hypothetical protein